MPECSCAECSWNVLCCCATMSCAESRRWTTNWKQKARKSGRRRSSWCLPASKVPCLFCLLFLLPKQPRPRNGIALHPVRFSIPDFSNEILECGASGSRQADITCSHVHITCSHLMSACLMHMPAYLCTTNQLSRIWPSSL